MPAEHRAVLLLLGLAVAGHGVRYLLTRPGEAPGAVTLLAGASPGAAAAHRDSVVRRARPLARGERVDVDRASAAELDRLPGIGVGLARRIVAHRRKHGPFGGLEGLDRVPGVGPALLADLKDAVAFSGRATAPAHASNAQGATPYALGPAPSAVSPSPSAPGPPPSAPSARGPSPAIDLNTAPATALQALPGIGPAKADAIVAYREAHGPFASIEGLLAVPGIGRSILARINGLAEVR